jgi:xanthine dehydrogenase iron-sulfur cluster and FAD-binding subunit A
MIYADNQPIQKSTSSWTFNSLFKAATTYKPTQKEVMFIGGAITTLGLCGIGYWVKKYFYPSNTKNKFGQEKKYTTYTDNKAYPTHYYRSVDLQPADKDSTKSNPTQPNNMPIKEVQRILIENQEITINNKDQIQNEFISPDDIKQLTDFLKEHTKEIIHISSTDRSLSSTKLKGELPEKIDSTFGPEESDHCAITAQKGKIISFAFTTYDIDEDKNKFVPRTIKVTNDHFIIKALNAIDLNVTNSKEDKRSENFIHALNNQG